MTADDHRIDDQRVLRDQRVAALPQALEDHRLAGERRAGEEQHDRCRLALPDLAVTFASLAAVTFASLAAVTRASLAAAGLGAVELELAEEDADVEHGLTDERGWRVAGQQRAVASSRRASSSSARLSPPKRSVSSIARS